MEHTTVPQMRASYNLLPPATGSPAPYPFGVSPAQLVLVISHSPYGM